MLSESHYLIRRILRFIALPYCFVKLVNWKECNKSPFLVFIDLLYIFFKYKYFPDNYSPCRFWEKDRSEWAYYYGSTYNSHPRHKLRKEVQPYEHQIIFNDKSVTELLFRGLKLPIPKCFGVISKREDLNLKLTEFFNQSDTDNLILKSIMGHAGRGIVLALKIDGEIFIKLDSELIPVKNYQLNDNVIVQEVVKQNAEISGFGASALSTIRIVTMLTKSNEVVFVSASMRFGVGKAFVDNWSAGGIAVGVDHKTGKLLEFAYDKIGNKHTEHPDSNKKFNGYQLPRWDEMVSIATRFQKHCTFYKFIGVDIALSENGPVIIEANANADIIFQEQTAGPLFKDKIILNEFNNYNLLVNKYQKALLKND